MSQVSVRAVAPVRANRAEDIEAGEIFRGGDGFVRNVGRNFDQFTGAQDYFFAADFEMQRTADALVKVGKISKVDLSPHWLVEDQPVPVERKGMPTWAKVTALGGFCFAVIIYLMMFLLSYKFLDDAMSTLGL